LKPKLIFAIATFATILLPGRETAKPSGRPNDALFSQQRAKRQAYSETETIQACSEDSANCYSLVADLEHEFDSQGNEVVYVERIHFPGYLNFSGATIPGSGIDNKERVGSFGW
jgi:hypothetical protein